MDLVDDIIARDGLTADDAARPWAFADDAFLEQMIDAPAPALSLALSLPLDLYGVETLDQARERIADRAAGFDPARLTPVQAAAVAFLFDDLPGLADAPAAEGPAAVPFDPPQPPPFDDGRWVLPGVMDDDFVDLDPDGRLAPPTSRDDGRFFLPADLHGPTFEIVLTASHDDSLQALGHGHPWLGHDDWLF